ncbi:MAG: malate dehydrogenase, partial [Candidatus Bathyarchaeota archaeon]|nr:malate dehydrogenase [Candidatus Bathyarchaeota archaeon]
HVTASIKLDVDVVACDKDEDVVGADIIVVSAGLPRMPGVKMTRRDLAVQNGQIVKHIAESTKANNPEAKYVVITNPVDAMAMVCKKYSDAEFVISTGTNLETLRFMSGLANALRVPVSCVEGYVGGEHGTDAIILWSTVKVDGLCLDDYLKTTGKRFVKDDLDSYVKSVSKLIVDNIGGTEYGPAASFRDIVRAIVTDSNELLPVAVPTVFEGIPEPVFVSVPLNLGSSVGCSIFDSLYGEEKKGIRNAANAIFETFKAADGC